MPHDLPPLRVMPKEISATCYNSVRLAMLRLGRPLRVVLAGHRGLEMVLTDNAWWCVDSLADDQPIMAWREFASHGRDNLALPVACQLFLYHHCAGLIMGTALSDLQHAVEARLAHARA